ncbi:DUF4097 family beta strand repeat-containing protein [Actinoallomurus rhizosphaericola]|uniref:DUF4097 family beta strand repeat-containing protein n=1 Tax=Actinoallomurus rhizosphaericola TaxID=2952536 RepID=UPI00209145E7|nr:DUF4097 family beta strand repeat-containing protein [Actinoallomurus rhizosphaericola]MCO5994779.1 DUF4097 family beta strand repeat-containing protein [Actinoallomurus rhizosphaericola]
MPTFASPEPISATLEASIAEVRVTASDRTDTVVEVRPADPSKASDVRAAEETTVEYTDGRLVIRRAKRRAHLVLGPKDAAVQVDVELPAGSGLHASLGMGNVHCAGRLGDCEISSGAGVIWVEDTHTLQVRTGGGDVTAGRVAGDARLTTGVGEIRLRRGGGTITIKTSSGAAWIGEAVGNTRARSASGDIVIDQAHADVDAKTAAGKIRIGEVSQGAVVIQTGAGQLEVGIREGTAAWLDVHATAGTMHNMLDSTDGPGAADRTVEIRARTGLGDIVIRRASLTAHE